MSKYWDMEEEEYGSRYTTVNRMTALRAYEDKIVGWLEAYPNMTAAQVRDWLREKHEIDANDRTVRLYVAKLREKTGLTKQAEPKREYEAVEERPKGHQMQLDFGEKTARLHESRSYKKLYFVVCTLSYSRYKWGKFQDRPFRSIDLTEALYQSFEYFGGMPRELVYDQDSILVASENGGDIIHTQVFASFLTDTKIGVRVCRKSDPQSKGLIESSVKFVKGNFMEYRIYTDIEEWNQSFGNWLIRTGNGNVHGTTKRKPAEMFIEEQEFLVPLYGRAPNQANDGKKRNVRPDNTILYASNRYSVPYGTYSQHKEVRILVEGEELSITSVTGLLIAKHPISQEKGKLVKPASHRKDRDTRIKEHLEEAIALLGEEFRPYLYQITQVKSRYVKEQFQVITQACKIHGRVQVLEAIKLCMERELYSAQTLVDATESLKKGGPEGELPKPELLEDPRYKVPVQQRSLSVYAEIIDRRTLDT